MGGGGGGGLSASASATSGATGSTFGNAVAGTNGISGKTIAIVAGIVAAVGLFVYLLRK